MTIIILVFVSFNFLREIFHSIIIKHGTNECCMKANVLVTHCTVDHISWRILTTIPFLLKVECFVCFCCLFGWFWRGSSLFRTQNGLALNKNLYPGVAFMFLASCCSLWDVSHHAQLGYSPLWCCFCGLVRR